MDAERILRASSKHSPYYWTNKDRNKLRALDCSVIAVSVFCLIGSIWGLFRIAELRRQQRALDAAATFYRTVREMHETAFAARHDANHPTRGLAAVADAIAYQVEIGMEAAAETEVAK